MLKLPLAERGVRLAALAMLAACARLILGGAEALGGQVVHVAAAGAPSAHEKTGAANAAGQRAVSQEDAKPKKNGRAESALRAALETAVREERLKDVRAIATRCNQRFVTRCGADQLLILAIRLAKPHAAIALLQGGTPAESRDADGQSALALATERGNAVVVRALLRAGADPGLRLPEGDTPMHRAAAYGRTNLIDLLAQAGADVDARIHSDLRRDGWTPLMVAAAEAQPPSVERLIAAGADLDTRNTRGRTALLIAAWYGSKPIVERLLRAGADRDTADVLGITPVDAAMLAGNPIVLGYLRPKQRTSSRAIPRATRRAPANPNALN